jgi:hypothetical protein
MTMYVVIEIRVLFYFLQMVSVSSGYTHFMLAWNKNNIVANVLRNRVMVAWTEDARCDPYLLW